MKFIKGVTTFLVLCLAVYGAFTLYTNLTKPPRIDLSGDDVNYLKSIGIEVRGDGRASESGINTMIDMEGVDPVGAAVGTSSGFAPPPFLGGQTAPSFTDAAPPYAAAAKPESSFAPAFPAPAADVLPPPQISEPAGSLNRPSPIQSLPTITPRSDTLPVPATESPPPWKDNWDGPASDISATPPPVGLLQSTNAPANPNTNPHPTSDVRTAYPFDGGSVRRIEPGSVKPTNTFAATDNVHMDTALPQYTQTAARQSLTFEPVRPDASSKAPLVAFAAPKRTNSLPPQQPATVHSEVKHVENPPPRPLGNPGDSLPAAPPPVPEAIERFVQSQRQLIETGEPENVKLAFIQLSRLYEHNQLGDAERAMMRPTLDALALKVIYSGDSHILESPYRVKPGETVESIAKDFNLNPVLLRKINSLAVPHELTPDTMLKVVYGQFDARISVKRKELTLLLGGLYAGQFSFTFPNAGMSMGNGEFFVTQRSDRTVVLNNGWMLAATPTKDATIVFADQDAREIFDILSEQSVIVVE